MKIKVIGKNKETQEDEVFDLNLEASEVACFYKDKYGIAVSTKQGKVYRVSMTMDELRNILTV